MPSVRVDREGRVAIVTIDRPEVRNAVDPATGAALVDAFRDFDADPGLHAAVLTGAGGTFCAGWDLKSLASGGPPVFSEEGPSPMGPIRMTLGKPVLAAVEGFAVAGGFELALWCDLRVAARDAVFGVFNRRFGVPLVDLGTVRLPRLIGHGRAMDLILTGRRVEAAEGLEIGLANRVVEPGRALEEAVRLGHEVAALPQASLRADRLSAIEQWGVPLEVSLRNEFRRGEEAIGSGEAEAGARRFAAGAGRHGAPTTERGGTA